MEGILENEQKLIYNIPKQIIGQDIKKDFMRARTQVMQRTYLTVAQNKIVSDWTLPKMVLQAKNE